VGAAIYAGSSGTGAAAGADYDGADQPADRDRGAARRPELSRLAQSTFRRRGFMRVLEVRLHPGREEDFEEAFEKLSAAYEKAQSDLPWVVYQ